MKTIFLDPVAWDLCLDTSGNIALAAEPYAVAQDVASECRLFSGELWYDTTRGIPYFSKVLGQPLNAAYYGARLRAAALSVPTVVFAKVTLGALQNRSLIGQIQFTTLDGTTQTVSASSSPYALLTGLDGSLLLGADGALLEGL